MIGVFVTFRYGDDFDEHSVRKIAEAARASFGGATGASATLARCALGARDGLFRSAGSFRGAAFRWGTPAPPQRQDEVHRVRRQHLRAVRTDPHRILDPYAEPALRIV